MAPKVRKFRSRVMQGIILVYSILRGRQIHVSDCCPVCANPGETVKHALFDFLYSQASRCYS